MIATAVAGASSENEAISAYVSNTSAAIAQHMQYLDITGTPSPKPKNWARGRKAPKWWDETLDQDIEPIKLNRKPQNDCWTKLSNGATQYGATVMECVTDLMATGRSDHVSQALYDVSRMLLSKVKHEDLVEAAQRLPERDRDDFIRLLEETKNEAAQHLEFV